MSISDGIAILGVAIVIVGAIVGFLIRLNVTQANHAQRLTQLEDDAKVTDRDMREVKALVTSTRELVIQGFGEVKAMIAGKRASDRAVADLEER
jgi:uncharacterized membrane-anchored protein YhcB (DUF1043 family)